MDPTVNPAFVIFAAISPMLIAFVEQSGWSRQTNALIALACYAIIGTVGALMSGLPFTLESVVDLIAVATVVGRAAYSMFWNVIGTDTQPVIGRSEGIVTGVSLDTRIT